MMITHSDYCPEDRGGEIEDCESCLAELEEKQAYYGALYRPRGYSIDELRDAYSDPSNHHKLISLERELN